MISSLTLLIILLNNNYLVISERSDINIAQDKPVKVFSLTGTFSHVDKLTSRDIYECFSSEDRHVYIIIDLKMIYDIRQVIFGIQPRQKTEFMDKFELAMLTHERSCKSKEYQYEKSCNHTTIYEKNQTVWNVSDKCVGRFLILRQTDKNEKLSIKICDLQVYGGESSMKETEYRDNLENRCYVTKTKDNIALFKPVLALTKYNQQKITDGLATNNTNEKWGQCYYSMKKQANGFVVDLKGVFEISFIRLWNCPDRRYGRRYTVNIGVSTKFRPQYWLHDLKHEVNWIGSELANKDRVLEIKPSNTTIGQYIYVEKPRSDLDIFVVCEIEVFGKQSNYTSHVQTPKIRSLPLYNVTKMDFPLMSTLLHHVNNTYAQIYTSLIRFIAPNCEGILWQSPNNWPYAVGCYFNKGRVFITGKSTYFKTDILNKFDKQFQRNLFDWLSNLNKTSNVNSLQSSKKQHYQFGDIIQFDVTHKMTNKEKNQLLSQLRNGEISLVLEVTNWSMKSKYFDNYGFILNALGVEMSYHYTTRPSGKVLVKDAYNYARFSLIRQAEFMRDSMDYLLDNGDRTVSEIESFSNIHPRYIRKISKVFQQILSKYELYLTYVCPAHHTRIKKNIDEKLVMIFNKIMISRVMRNNFNYTAPCFDVFPGEIKQWNSSYHNLNYSIKVTVESKYRKEIQPIGLYVPAGTRVNYTIVSSKGSWKYLIGSQTDKLHIFPNHLWYHWYRYPLLTVQDNLDTTNLTQGSFYSPFGGLLNFYMDKGLGINQTGKLEVNIFGAVRSHLMDLHWNNYKDLWMNKLNFDTPWTEIAGQYVVAVVPYKSIRGMSTKKLELLLNTWDKMISLMYIFKGSRADVHPRLRIVVDDKTYGGAHSGYPTVVNIGQLATLLDLSKLQTPSFGNIGFLLMAENLVKYMQLPKPYKLLSGLLQDFVTSTLWNRTMYDNSSLISSKLRQRILSHFPLNAAVPSYEAWKKDYNLNYLLYGDLRIKFGWGLFQQVLQNYTQELTLRLYYEQKRMDRWVETLSYYAQMNLAPIFDVWNIPISKSAMTRLTANSSNPCYLPKDAYCDVAKKRCQFISKKYGDKCVDKPSKYYEPNIIPEYEFIEKHKNLVNITMI